MSEEKSTAELEEGLRKLWAADGVSRQDQDILINHIKEKAQSGAKVGPFTLGGSGNE